MIQPLMPSRLPRVAAVAACSTLSAPRPVPQPELQSMGTARRLGALAAILTLASVSARAQTYPTGNDPRNGLKAGMYDAGTAAQGMRLVSFSKKPAEFDSVRGLTFINSDIAFRDHYVYQGNFAGFTIWDVKNPSKPE